MGFNIGGLIPPYKGGIITYIQKTTSKLKKNFNPPNNFIL